MSKIDLSKYDFKDVLEWVCDQFPDDNSFLGILDSDRKFLKINGYVISRKLIWRSIVNNEKGLRQLARDMCKIKENHENTFISLSLNLEVGEGKCNVNIPRLAEMLKPYLKDE